MFMQQIIHKIFSLVLVLSFLFTTGCRKEELVFRPSESQVTEGETLQNITGFYLLNQGNMGSNKASLDYFDYESGRYFKNIYADRNPGVVHELGDVGNDLKIYGDRLYAVINCSHMVEVMDVRTAKHIGQVSIPNCRYITFKDNFAYVTSYNGPVQIDPNSRPGYVAKIDLSTLKVVDDCIVGYQPQDLAIVGNKLYVANSGGYRAPDYDRRVSVIDLSDFELIKWIDVDINLNRMAVAPNGDLYVTSQGDYKTQFSRTYVIDTEKDEVKKALPGLAATSMAPYGEQLYIIGDDFNDVTKEHRVSYSVWNTETMALEKSNFIVDGTDVSIQVPYAIAVNPENGDVFVTDARDYVTPGTVACYWPNGVRKWSTVTGDIPACVAFTTEKVLGLGASEDSSSPDDSSDGEDWMPYSKVYEYLPAPGQFINAQEIGGEKISSMAEACEYADGQMKGGNVVSLGGFGGYLVVGFDRPVRNVGAYEIAVRGNAFDGSSEPGIVYVMQDVNGNGLPDDVWYELQGSESDKSETRSDYEVTYYRPEGAGQDVKWVDNYGDNGVVTYNMYHRQSSYYPSWVKADSYKLCGTCLKANTYMVGSIWRNGSYAWGYADNFSSVIRAGLEGKENKDRMNYFRIDDAVDENGAPANLDKIDFVKVQTGVNFCAGDIGEVSTEVGLVLSLIPEI